jgi:hypothetical protein
LASKYSIRFFAEYFWRNYFVSCGVLSLKPNAVQGAKGHRTACLSLTSAVESQFFIFWAGKSYRFNKSLRNGENSDEYE